MWTLQRTAGILHYTLISLPTFRSSLAALRKVSISKTSCLCGLLHQLPWSLPLPSNTLVRLFCGRPSRLGVRCRGFQSLLFQALDAPARNIVSPHAAFHLESGYDSALLLTVCKYCFISILSSTAETSLPQHPLSP